MTASASTARITSLDVIRGVAVMGIFSVNVIAFAMLEPAYFNPSFAGGYHGENLAIWLANFILIDGKMRSLFSMLFGASMLLVIDRAIASGQSGASVHYRRMIVLALFGLLHFYFIWWGDILFLYAVTGMVAYIFRTKSAKSLLAIGIAFLVANSALFGAGAAHFRELDIAAHSPGATQQQIKEWNESIQGWGKFSASRSAEETMVSRSGFAVRAEHVLSERFAEPFRGISFFLPETLGLMLLGMACYKSGYFTGEWSDERYRRAALWGLGIGAAAFAVMGIVEIRAHFYLPLLFFTFLAVAMPFRVIMALGYAALIILLARRPSPIRDRFAAVGRAAFTNYLGTSIIAGLIFYGDGLGLFGKLSRFEAWLVVPLIWLTMLAWSKPWLDRFRYGPFEWAWRSLARWEVQPMRKAVGAPA